MISWPKWNKIGKNSKKLSSNFAYHFENENVLNVLLEFFKIIVKHNFLTERIFDQSNKLLNALFLCALFHSLSLSISRFFIGLFIYVFFSKMDFSCIRVSGFLIKECKKNENKNKHCILLVCPLKLKNYFNLLGWLPEDIIMLTVFASATLTFETKILMLNPIELIFSIRIFLFQVNPCNNS